jgi:pimeloyl-ACP methyl ester carboxylesterase
VTIARGLTLAVAGLAAIAIALWQLLAATCGLTITRTVVGTTPVTVFAPKSGARGPVVVIAHGFAGSQQVMQPFAVSLSRNGYVAVTFDFLGHGRNPRPLTGRLTAAKGATTALVDEMAEVVAFARRLPQGDGRLAVLGHSMGSDIAVRYAQGDPEVAATIAVSMFSMVVTAVSPRNLLVIDGALESSAFRNKALHVVAMAAGPELPREQVTYGSFSAGTARRAAFAPGVEHISVLYSRAGLAEALDWLNAVFDVQPPASGDGTFIDARGPWLGLLFLGLTVLGRPLCELLPRVASRPLGASLPWRTLLPLALGPAILTPLILWKMPTDFLHVGDYLALHFALYGVLTGSGLMILRWTTRPEPGPAASLGTASLGAGAASIAGMALYCTGMFGLALDTFVTSFVPGQGRLLLVPALLVGTLPYFIADEWLTRGACAPRGSYLVTKICFLLSLALAVAFNMQKLFFLVIIVPIILVLFVISGLFSGWVYRRTNHPLVGAIVNAVALSWAVAATLPLLAR